MSKIWVPGVRADKDPNDVSDWLMDFGPLLEGGDTIDIVIGATAAGGISVDQILFDTTTVTIFVSGGTIGIEARVDVRIRTSNATPRTFDRALLFNIVDL